MALFTLTYKAGYIWEQGTNTLFFHISVDGSLSDTTVDNLHRNQRMDPRGSSGAIRQGPNSQSGLGKKSNSTSQLSAAGNDALKNLIYLAS